MKREDWLAEDLAPYVVTGAKDPTRRTAQVERTTERNRRILARLVELAAETGEPETALELLVTELGSSMWPVQRSTILHITGPWRKAHLSQPDASRVAAEWMSLHDRLTVLEAQVAGLIAVATVDSDPADVLDAHAFTTAQNLIDSIDLTRV